MRAILMILILACATACATKQERARKLIDKANKLYPIAQMVDTVIYRDTVLVKDTTIIVKKDTVYIRNKVEVVNGKVKPYNNREILDNEKATVFASMDSLGNQDFQIFIKEKKIPVRIEYRYRDSIQVKKELITSPPQVIMVRGLIWWFGVLCGLAILLFYGFKGYRYYKSKTSIL